MVAGGAAEESEESVGGVGWPWTEEGEGRWWWL